MRIMFNILVWLKRQSIARAKRKSLRKSRRKVLKEMVIRQAENSPYILLCTSHSENVAKELLEKLGIKYKLTISSNGVRYFKEIKYEQEN